MLQNSILIKLQNIVLGIAINRKTFYYVVSHDIKQSLKKIFSIVKLFTIIFYITSYKLINHEYIIEKK